MFNDIQRSSFEDVFNNGRSVAIKAPTGSGKTVVFEMAVLKLIIGENFKHKILYVSPLKSLCRERSISWDDKFRSFNLKGIALTSDKESIMDLNDYQLIYTTPEKLDWISRKRSSFNFDFNDIRLVCIDEIHTLDDGCRGATLEAVITRLKNMALPETMFVAASATINNLQDIAEWLSTDQRKCALYRMEERKRTVQLEKVLLAYPRPNGQSLFQFDNVINHKIPNILVRYAAGKPVLIFCITRKSTAQLAKFLIENTRFELDADDLQQLATISQKIEDAKLRGCTSTLAMGVNLPAHLVVVKGTRNFNFSNNNGEENFSQNTLLQMIGRAGRPQFDTTAVAVIMTTTQDQMEIETLLRSTTQAVESQLLQNLVQHLNAEIAIGTINSASEITQWICNTFLYIRCQNNPSYYSLPVNSSKEIIAKRLNEKVNEYLQQLIVKGMVKYNNIQSDTLVVTRLGNLMSGYFLTIDTMQKMQHLSGKETLQSLLEFLSQCGEFSDLTLRYNERTYLNNLNRSRGPYKLKFPLKSRITTTEAKISCLIQATLNGQKIAESSLVLDMEKIFRISSRILRCLHEYLGSRTVSGSPSGGGHRSMVSCSQLRKSVLSAARLWHDSWMVACQLTGVGPVLGEYLAAAGYNNLHALATARPHDINLLLKRSSPFGEKLVESASGFPRYELTLEQLPKIEEDCCLMSISIVRKCQLVDAVSPRCNPQFEGDFMHLIIGDRDNKILYQGRIGNKQVEDDNEWRTELKINRSEISAVLEVDLISENYVGFDIHIEFQPTYKPKVNLDLPNKIEEKQLQKSYNKISLKEALVSALDSKQHQSGRDASFSTPTAGKRKIFSWKTCALNKSRDVMSTPPLSSSKSFSATASALTRLSFGVTDQQMPDAVVPSAESVLGAPQCSGGTVASKKEVQDASAARRSWSFSKKAALVHQDNEPVDLDDSINNDDSDWTDVALSQMSPKEPRYCLGMELNCPMVASSQSTQCSIFELDQLPIQLDGASVGLGLEDIEMESQNTALHHTMKCPPVTTFKTPQTHNSNRGFDLAANFCHSSFISSLKSPTKDNSKFDAEILPTNKQEFGSFARRNEPKSIINAHSSFNYNLPSQVSNTRNTLSTSLHRALELSNTEKLQLPKENLPRTPNTLISFPRKMESNFGIENILSTSYTSPNTFVNMKEFERVDHDKFATLGSSGLCHQRSHNVSQSSSHVDDLENDVKNHLLSALDRIHSVSRSRIEKQEAVLCNQTIPKPNQFLFEKENQAPFDLSKDISNRGMFPFEKEFSSDMYITPHIRVDEYRTPDLSTGPAEIIDFNNHPSSNTFNLQKTNPNEEVDYDRGWDDLFEFIRIRGLVRLSKN